MKKTGLLLLLSYTFVSLLGTNSSLILNAKLDDIPEWVKPNAYLTYKAIATDIDGTQETATTRLTVLSVRDEITVQITNTGRGKTSEEVMTTPNVHLFFTQPEIEKIKAGSTRLDTMGGGNKVFSYVGEETINTPAGSFLCHKFRVKWDLGTIDEWVEKNTGISVKSFYDNDVGTTFDINLQETNIDFSAHRRAGTPWERATGSTINKAVSGGAIGAVSSAISYGLGSGLGMTPMVSALGATTIGVIGATSGMMSAFASSVASRDYGLSRGESMAVGIAVGTITNVALQVAAAGLLGATFSFSWPILLLGVGVSVVAAYLGSE